MFIKRNKLFTSLLIIMTLLTAPISTFAAEPLIDSYYIFDSDELRLTNLEGELLLDYFEPTKTNLKTETVLSTPTSNPQNIRNTFTFCYEYDTLGNIILFDYKNFDHNQTIKQGQTFLYSYNENQQISAYTLTEHGLRWGNPVTYQSNYFFQYTSPLLPTSASYNHQTIGAGNATYTYNDKNQIASITFNLGSSNYKKEYFYDTSGNCIEYRCGSFQNYYTYNTLNQIVTLRAVSYLDNGSTLSDTTYHFTYDVYGNISAVTVNSISMTQRVSTYNLTVQNQYDSSNRLIARTMINPNSGFTNTYVYEYIN